MPSTRPSGESWRHSRAGRRKRPRSPIARQQRKSLRRNVDGQGWLDANFVNITVKDGVVELAGFVGSNDQRIALRVLAEETDGVVRVDDHLSVGMPHIGV